MAEAEATVSGLSSQWPWPGIRSFRENDSRFFYGRERDTKDVFSLVRRAPAVVLYGLSGLGKTSLLQAGLFPLMRESGLLPIPISISYSSESGPVESQIRQALFATLEAEHVFTPATVSGDTLWEYFHDVSLEFRGDSGRRLMPVLVIDHCEQAFTIGQRDDQSMHKVEQLQSELQMILEHRPPASVRARLNADPLQAEKYDLEQQAVKVLIALREDFLPQLDTWRMRIPSLLNQRYRLERMDEQQALRVVLDAGTEVVDRQVAPRIIQLANDSERQRLSGRATGSRQIEPTLLSLVCERLNSERRDRGIEKITSELVDEIGEGIIRRFYEDSFVGLIPAVREWVETRLITVSGFRQAAEENDAIAAGRTRAELDTLIERRLLHREEHKEGGYWVELTHDRLTDPACRSRDARLQRETFKNLTRRAQAIAAGFRAELSRPTATAVESTASAVLELEALIPDKAADPELRAWQAVAVGLAAEVFAEAARLEEASKYVERARVVAAMVGDGATESTPYLVARAQAEYVAGLIGVVTGPLLAARVHFLEAVQRAEESKDDQAEPDLARDMIRVGVCSRLRLAEIAFSQYDYADARKIADAVTEISEGALQLTRDESTAWKILALMQKINLEPTESTQAWKWYEAADREVGHALSSDPSNPRWWQLELDVLISRASRANTAGKLPISLTDVKKFRHRMESVPPELRDQFWFRLRSVRCDRAEGTLHLRGQQWDTASELFERSYSNTLALSQAIPHHIKVVWELSICHWRLAEHARQHFEAQPEKDRSSSEIETAIAHFQSAEVFARDALDMAPDNYRGQRDVAVCVGSLGLSESKAGRAETAEQRLRTACDLLISIPAPASDAGDVLLALAFTRERLAEFAEAREDRPAMIRELEAAIRVREAQASDSPAPLAHLRWIATLHQRIAATLERSRELDRADSEFEAAANALVRALKSLDSDSVDGEESQTVRFDPADERAVLVEKMKLELARAVMLYEHHEYQRAVEPLCQAGQTGLDTWIRSRSDDVRSQLNEIARNGDALVVKLRSLKSAHALPNGPGPDAIAPDTSGKAEPTGDEKAISLLVWRIRLALKLVPEHFEVHDGVRVPNEAQNWSLPAVIAGPWRTLPPHQQAKELERLPDSMVSDITRKSVVRLRELVLECYANAKLFEAEVGMKPGIPPTTFLYIRYADGIKLLTGKSAPFHELNQIGILRVPSEQQAIEYLSLFVNTLQVDDDKFFIIQQIDDLQWEEGAPAALKKHVGQAIRPLVLSAEARGGWTSTATINFRDQLSYARIQVYPDGLLEMLEDDWFAYDLPVAADAFVGQFRTLPEPHRFRAGVNLAVRRKDWPTAAALAEKWTNLLRAPDEKPSPAAATSAFHSLCLVRLASGDPAGALSASEEGIGIAKEETPGLLAAKVHALLTLGRVTEAEEICFRDRDEDAKRKWLETLDRDWVRLKETAIWSPDFENLKEKLHQSETPPAPSAADPPAGQAGEK